MAWPSYWGVAFSVCALATAVLSLGCSSSKGDCKSDADCKEERLCVAGSCRVPEDATSGAGGADGRETGAGTTSRDPSDDSCEESADCDDYQDGYAVCVVDVTMSRCQYVGAECDAGDDQPCKQSAADCWGADGDQRGQCLVDAPSVVGLGCDGPEDCESGAFCVENQAFNGFCYEPGR